MRVETAEQAVISADAGAPVPPMGCQNLVGQTCIVGSNLPYECCKPGNGVCVPDVPGGAIGRCMLGGVVGHELGDVVEHEPLR